MTKLATKSAPTAAATTGQLALPTIEKILGLTLATARERYSRLTRREVQVAGMLASGKANREIAEELGISPKTLDIHRANVMHKLLARTTAQVANLVNLLRITGDSEALES